MIDYLLIESRDPFESREVDNNYTLAANLSASGHNTTLFLVQNGVFPARDSGSHNGLEELLKKGVKVVCDDFSLTERGIKSDAITGGIDTDSLEFVIQCLANEYKTIWL